MHTSSAKSSRVSSTGVACMNLGRHFIGFEKDETYFETAKARVLAAKNELGLPNG